MGKSSAASAAAAACDHVHDLWFGTVGDSWASMAVISDGNQYGVPEGIMYSFPCRIAPGGSWEVVNGLAIKPGTRKRLFNNVLLEFGPARLLFVLNHELLASIHQQLQE